MRTTRLPPAPGHRPRARPVVRACLAAVLVTTAAGCRAGIDALAERPATARVAADQLVASLQYRFTNPVRDARYEAGRLRIARLALAPRALLADTLWTARVGEERRLTGHGRLVDNRRYAFAAVADVPPPTTIGESRHVTALTPLGGDDFRWRTQVDQALGIAAPRAVAAAFTALLASAERPPATVRADYRRAAPAAAAQLGRLFTLDSIATARDADGATSVRLRIAIHGDSLRTEYPAFAEYLHKYVTPARYRIALRDPGGEGVTAADTWFLAEAEDDTLTLSWRSRGGALLPLAGPPRRRPDTLRLDVTAFAKIALFTVGASDLRGRFVFVGGDTAAGWDVRFRDEPAWHLPPIIGRLLRTPLRRPFEGDGTHVVLTVRRDAGGTTLLHRRLDFAVRESAIMRWLGRLGFTALDDFAGRVERDEARYFAAVLAALRADVGAPGGR